jgi:hypothetical protein
MKARKTIKLKARAIIALFSMDNSSGHRVPTPGMKRMAAQQAPQAQVQAPPEAVAGQGLGGVMGATGGEPAATGKHG